MGCFILRHIGWPIKRSRDFAVMTQLAMPRRCVATSSGGRLTGPQLTKRIKAAESVHDLFAIHARHRAEYNGIAVSATWTQLSKLTRGRKGAAPKAQLGELVQDTARMAAQGELRDRGLANVAYAIARINKKPDQHIYQLLDKLACESAASIGKFDSQGLSNTAWAFATVGRSSPALFEAVSRASAARIDQFSPQELSNTAWAFATVGHASPALFEAVSRASAASIDQFNPQNLANAAWAFATVGHASPALFEAVSRASAASIDQFNPQNLANMAWAFATVGHASPALFEALSRASAASIDQFKPQELANTAWAFATVGHASPALFESLSRASAARIDQFNPQDLANTAWAFATVGHASPALFEALSRASAASIDQFKPQELANTAWAFATVGHASPALFEASSRASMASIDQFSPQELANTAWAFAVADHSLPDSFSQHLVQITENADLYSSEALCQLHQWRLWTRERGVALSPSRDFSERCKVAFIANQPRPSRMQRQVETTVSALGLPYRAEVITEIGYSIDIVAEWQGAEVGIEVDGPSHFLGRDPSGPTLLKRRQLRKLEGWMLCSVPSWEWSELSSDAKCRQQYLVQLLERASQGSQ